MQLAPCDTLGCNVESRHAPAAFAPLAEDPNTAPARIVPAPAWTVAATRTCPLLYMHRKRSTYKVFSNRFLGVCPSWLYLLIAAGFCLCLWQYLRQQLHLWLWILFFFFTFLFPFCLISFSFGLIRLLFVWLGSVGFYWFCRLTARAHFNQRFFNIR